MKQPALVLSLIIAAFLGGCSAAGTTAPKTTVPPAGQQPKTATKTKVGCAPPVTAYIFQGGIGGLLGESSAWQDVYRPLGGSGIQRAIDDHRLVEAVVASSTLWTVEDLWLTPADAKRVKAQWMPGTFVLTPVAAKVCFRSRDAVSVLSAGLARGAGATRALQLAEGIELAVPAVAKPGGDLTVVFSQGSLYDETYRGILPNSGQNVVLYAYNQAKDLLYQLTLQSFFSANDQDVFVFALPQDTASGAYSLVFQQPGLPRSLGMKPGEPGFMFADGAMDGGFTFQVQ